MTKKSKKHSALLATWVGGVSADDSLVAATPILCSMPAGHPVKIHSCDMRSLTLLIKILPGFFRCASSSATG